MSSIGSTRSLQRSHKATRSYPRSDAHRHRRIVDSFGFESGSGRLTGRHHINGMHDVILPSWTVEDSPRNIRRVRIATPVT